MKLLFPIINPDELKHRFSTSFFIFKLSPVWGVSCPMDIGSIKYECRGAYICASLEKRGMMKFNNIGKKIQGKDYQLLKKVRLGVFTDQLKFFRKQLYKVVSSFLFFVFYFCFLSLFFFFPVLLYILFLPVFLFFLSVPVTSVNFYQNWRA